MYKNLARFTESNSPAAQRSLAHVIIIAKLKNLSFTDSTAQLQIHFEIWPFNHLSRYLGGQDRCFVTENREENLSKLPWLSDRIWARKIDDKQIELTELKTVGEEALSSNLTILEFMAWLTQSLQGVIEKTCLFDGLMIRWVAYALDRLSLK